MHKPATPDAAFDAAKADAEYRRVIAQRDAATTKSGRAKFGRIAVRMPQAGKEWQGEDSLHEMAFGEPDA